MVTSWQLSNETGQISWALGKKGKFSTKSVYTYLERTLVECDFRWIWKAKIPLKIQIFLWQLFQDAVLTREVMKKRKWAGNPKCLFYNEVETSQHLFFTCPVARVVWRTVGCVFGTSLCPNNLWQYFSWCYIFLPDGAKFYTFGLAAICWAIWNCRNQATFEHKSLKSPFNVVYAACGFLMYWAGLQKPEIGEMVKKGAEMLKENTTQMMLLCGPPIPARDGHDGD